MINIRKKERKKERKNIGINKEKKSKLIERKRKNV